jgi:hypothetical protein
VCAVPYVLRGKLCGFICDECWEPLARVVVRAYAVAGEAGVAAAAAARPTETFALLEEDDVKDKQSRLLAEAETDDAGAFTLELDDEQYDGGPFEIDVYCAQSPRPGVPSDAGPLQFSVTTLQPRWRPAQIGFVAAWEYCLSPRWWCAILARFGIWTICGVVTTCRDQRPIPGATVTAFDVDWLQDDPLGSATTDINGHFLISFARAAFEKTPLSPFINFELVGGPDVYFKVELGGSPIIQETAAQGRTPGRENIGPCTCVRLCTDEVVVGDPETVPHWLEVEDFNIHPAPGTPGADFSVEGYAGNPSSGAFVFGGGVRLRGNCPLTNVATTNPLEYRFQIGEWTWSTPGDDPTTLPSVAPAAMTPVTQIATTRVGYVFYTDGNGMAQSAPVDVGAADATADGWIRLQGKAITVPMFNPPGTTSVVNIDHTNFLRTFDLLVLNSPVITAAHPTKLPAGLPKAEAGRSLTTAEQEPIRRYRLQFEVRDAGTLASLPGDTLDAVILDNTPVIRALNLEELLANACNPLAGAAQAHLLYTVDHPHLRWFDISIWNNNGTVHPPPAHSGSPTTAMPSGAFAAGNFFFRGGAGGPHVGGGTGGVPVDISGDPACAYSVTLRWVTRRYYDSTDSVQILYCK